MWKWPNSEPPPDPQPTEVVPDPAPWWEETIWAFIGDFATVLILAISVYVAVRALKAVREDHRRQRKHDQISVMPAISFLRKEHAFKKGVEITVSNSGLGPAILRNVRIFRAVGPEETAHITSEMTNPSCDEITEVIKELLEVRSPGGLVPKENQILQIGPGVFINPNEDPKLLIGLYNDTWGAPEINEVGRRLCCLKFAFEYQSVYGVRDEWIEPHGGWRP